MYTRYTEELARKRQQAQERTASLQRSALPTQNPVAFVAANPTTTIAINSIAPPSSIQAAPPIVAPLDDDDDPWGPPEEPPDA